MLKAKNKNVVDIIFNNKHATKVYKGLELVWQKIADLLHLTQVCGNSVQNGIPSPSNPIEIKSVGDKTKNLLNLNGDITLGYRLNTISAIGKGYGTLGNANDFITDGAYCVSELMEIKPNTNYAKNTPATAYYRIHFYDSDKICVSVTNSSIAPSPANAKYMAICLPIAELSNNIQVEENSVVTDYEPFGYKLSVDVNGTISTCYLEQPLRKIGNEWDEIYRDDDGYHIERRIGKIDLKNINFSQLSGYPVFSSGVVRQLTPNVNPISTMLNSTEYAPSLSISNMKKDFCIKAHWSTNIFYISDNVHTNNTDFNNFIRSLDDETFIVLANSTFEDITWDVEPLIPVDTDVVFLTEIQPSDYTIE